MNGARTLASDWVLGHIPPLCPRVVDIGSGDGEIAQLLEAATKAQVLTVDIDGSKGVSRKVDLVLDVRQTPWPWPTGSVDCILAAWVFQHLIGREAAVWAETGRVLRRGGIFVALGRYAKELEFETARKDPLRPDNENSIKALSMASGLDVLELQLFRYDEVSYMPADPHRANAFALMAKKGEVK